MTHDRMPCMAVKQPYASLLVAGIKDVENRNRWLPDQLKGRWCAIYASKTLAPVGAWVHAMYTFATHAMTAERVDGWWPWSGDAKAGRKQCTRGAIVGLVKWDASRTVRKAMDAHTSPWAELGMHHWTYSDRIVLPEPVPLPDGGCQSIYWYLDEETRENVYAAVNALPHHVVRRGLIFTPHSMAMARQIDGISPETQQLLAEIAGK